MLQLTDCENTQLSEGAPGACVDHRNIRVQLQRILNSPGFRTSKRYPRVLRYLVDRALENSQEAVKERTIGVEVLGRDPDYDTNQDPTVRVVAGEIRKRLLSYYGEPEHAAEFRIELPIGSYTPRFSIPASPSVAGPLMAAERPILAEPAPEVKRKRGWSVWALGASFAAALLVFAVSRLIEPRTALDRFWDPVVHGSPTVLLSVAEKAAWGAQPRLDDPMQPSAISATSPDLNGAPNSLHRFLAVQPTVSIMNLTATSNIAGFLRPRTSRELIRPASATSLADLRQGPAVLIGSFTNYWTMHVSEDLRFQLRRSDALGISWVEDRQNPGNADWAVKLNDPLTEAQRDYAIITRIRDSSTGQIVVSIAGLTPIGTLAASEFLMDRGDWDTVARGAPRDWEHKNLQLVIAVSVINGNGGSPTLVATCFWGG